MPDADRQGLLRPELDGTGGGYGRFAGKTIGEIQQIFSRCEEEPSMRSVSIVLRVAREQLDARGSLGHYPVLAIIAAGCFGASFLVRGLLPESVQANLPKFQISLGVVAFALGVGVFITAHDRRVGIAQEKAIVELARETLDRIVLDASFRARPLDFTQDLTLRRLLMGTKDRACARLLAVE